MPDERPEASTPSPLARLAQRVSGWRNTWVEVVFLLLLLALTLVLGEGEVDRVYGRF